MLNKFLSGNFKTASLVGRCINDEMKLVLIINYKDKTQVKFDFSDMNLFNQLLNFYLTSDEVIGIKYDTYIPGYMDNYNITIIKLKSCLNLSFDNNMLKFFPDIVKKLEMSKRNGILNYLTNNIENTETINITNLIVDSSSYINHSEAIIYGKQFNYMSLQVIKNGVKNNYNFEFQFIKEIIKTILKNEQLDIENEIKKISDFSLGEKIQIGSKKIKINDECIVELINECLIELMIEKVKGSKI